MKRTLSFLLVSTLALTTAPALRADVKTQHKTTFQMGGMLGSIANRFAGDAAKDGLVYVQALQHLFDLDDEAVEPSPLKERTSSEESRFEPELGGSGG